MDTLTAFVCLAVGSALPVVGLFLLVSRGLRQLAVARSYGDVSRRLGLDVDTRGVSLHGHLGEQRIWVGQVLVGHGPDRRMACWGVLDLERPLGLGFLLRRRGLRERLRRPRGPALALGDDLDRLVEVHGDDADRVRRLLDPHLRDLLHGALARWRELVITDASVRVMLRRPPARPDELHDLVNTMRTLAAALVQARVAVPPPPPLAAWAPACELLANELGLTFEPAYPGVAGTVDGRPLRITPLRSDDGYRAELRLGLLPHRRTGLAIRPQRGLDSTWSGGQDIQFDDPAFDQTFLVKGYDPEQVREIVGPDVRARLLALATTARIDVDDLRLHAGGLPLDAAALVPFARGVRDVAAALGW